MEFDQAQPYHPGKSSKTLSAKNERQALPLKKSRLSSELETLRAVSKRTFSSGNRMAVHNCSEPFSTWCRGGRKKIGWRRGCIDCLILWRTRCPCELAKRLLWLSIALRHT
jgi:hypothetical protein